MQLLDSKSRFSPRLRVGISAVIVACLLATACGGDDDGDTAAPPLAPEPAPAPAGEAVAFAPPSAPEPPPPPAVMIAPDDYEMPPPPASPPAPEASAAAEAPAAAAEFAEGRQAAAAPTTNALAEAQAAADDARTSPGSAAPAAPATTRAAEESAWGSVEPTRPGECWGCSSNIFWDYGVNPFVDTYRDALSTFALDVDTASYVVSRNHLQGGVLPPMEAVRVEEFVNYFDGGYQPEWDEFVIDMEAAPSPFSRDGYVLLLCGRSGSRRAGRRRDSRQRDRRDGQVGVDEPGRGLQRQMASADRAGARGGEPAAGRPARRNSRRHRLLRRQRGHRCGADRRGAQPGPDHAARPLRGPTRGSTNVEAGLLRGYDLALDEARSGRSVLVMLLSDGVANVGATRTDDILREIGDREDIGLTTIGVGLGPFNDVLMEQLANSADGTYHYIDTTDEARRIFGANIVSLLALAARTPRSRWSSTPTRCCRTGCWASRTATSPTRTSATNTVDAGEVGLGQSSTALYELELTRRGRERGDRDWLATATLRYQRPRRGSITEIEASVSEADIARSFASASPHFRLAAAAAEFAEVLRRSPFVEYRDADMGLLSEEAWYVADDLRRDTDAEELAQLIDIARRASR